MRWNQLYWSGLGGLLLRGCLRPHRALGDSDPFDKAEVESLLLYHLHPAVPDQLERTSQEVLPLKRHAEHLKNPLNAPDQPVRAGDVIDQKQTAARPQHPGHLR